jgi:hypothetical protein
MLFRSVYGAIAVGKRTENSLFATAADGHQEVAVCEAIIRSNKARKWAKV